MRGKYFFDTPYYWASDASAEVEFVIQHGADIVPIEVKSEKSIGGKSLSEYNKRCAPRYRIRFSMLNLQFNDGMLSCPAPLAGWMGKLFDLLDNA